MTGGGPGTATEPIALLTFSMLLQNLRFGIGAALSIIVFASSFVLAVVSIRILGREVLLERVR
jgi:ABC-type sugar transport system permease subunit